MVFQCNQQSTATFAADERTSTSPMLGDLTETLLWWRNSHPSLHEGSTTGKTSYRTRYADPFLEKTYRELLDLAESYFVATGQHLQVYGDIGELFGAISYGIRLHKNYAQGSDGRLGNDFVEIKTISPFKSRAFVKVKTTGHFSKLLVVKIDNKFRVSGRMVDRKTLPKTDNPEMFVRWKDLAALK